MLNIWFCNFFQICICQLIGPVLSNFNVRLQRGICYGLNISVNSSPYRPHTCLDLNVLKSNVGHKSFLYLCISNLVLTLKPNLNILTLNKSSAFLSTHFIELIVWNNARYLIMMAVLALPLKYISSFASLFKAMSSNNIHMRPLSLSQRLWWCMKQRAHFIKSLGAHNPISGQNKSCYCIWNNHPIMSQFGT